MTTDVREVEKFWDVEACGTHFVEKATRDCEFYQSYREFRFRTEWHLLEIIPFAESKGKKVLEIGCGNGADGTMFAQAGATYTGVDLTEAAVQATCEHLACLKLSGHTQIENAEHLSFPCEAFDLVYSHGVLHHTPEPQKAFDEVYRVLAPKGKAVIMLYHKNSFNYYVRILIYMRGRAILITLLNVLNWRKDHSALKKDQHLGLRGNEKPEVYRAHYENFLLNGWTYFSARKFVHHATDGPDCPYAYVYSKGDIRRMFSRFKSLKFKVAHFPMGKYTGGSALVKSLERRLSSWMGWYLFVYAEK